MSCEWIDLLDPDEAALREAWPDELYDHAVEVLLAPSQAGDEARPRLEGNGSYVLGSLLVPVVVVEEDRIFYQEIGLLLSATTAVTVRKTPAQGWPIDLTDVESACQSATSAGMVAYHVVDQVAEGFLDLVDGLSDEVDEMEDHVDDWDGQVLRKRLSELRHDLLHIRRTLAPTRDAVRRVVDDRVDLDEGTLFPREVEVRFGDAFDKLLRATEGLELARDLIAGVRDYHQSKVANDQNEVMKRLTVVASLLLPPTFIVGLYGQNFDNIPELHWVHGYGFSWALIVVSTLGQLWYFRRRHWL